MFTTFIYEEVHVHKCSHENKSFKVPHICHLPFSSSPFSSLWGEADMVAQTNVARFSKVIFMVGLKAK